MRQIRTGLGQLLCVQLDRSGDFSTRFPLIVAAVEVLPVESCVVDGEAIACDETGPSVFEMIRWRQDDTGVSLCAIDLMELDGEDLRREPIEVRKATLKGLIAPRATRHRVQPPFRSRRYGRLRTGLRARLRGHRLEALRLTVSVGP